MVAVVVSGEEDAVDTKVVGSAVGAVIMAMGVGVGRTRVRAGVRIGAISSSPPSRDGFVCLFVCDLGLSVSSFTRIVHTFCLPVISPIHAFREIRWSSIDRLDDVTWDMGRLWASSI